MKHFPTLFKLPFGLRTCCFLVSLITGFATPTLAQTTVSEGFNQSGPYPSFNMPFGWSSGKIVGSDPQNYWDRVNVGTHPGGVPTMGGSAAMLRYYSWATTAGEQAFVMSKPFDLTNRPVASSSNVRFWMYRDPEFAAPTAAFVSAQMTSGNDTVVVLSNTGIAVGQSVVGTNVGFNAKVVAINGNNIVLSVPSTGSNTNAITFYQQQSDNIQVYANTTASLAGATLLSDTANGASTIYRYVNCWPQGTGNTYGWNKYGFTIPAGASWNGSKVFIIIVSTSQFGNDIYIDDFSIDTYPKPMAYVSCTLDAQNALNVGSNTTNNWIVRGKIICDGAGSPITATAFTFNRNGSTNPCGDITGTGAKLWFTGGTKTFDSQVAVQLGGNQSACPTNYTFTGLTQTLENDTNYFWITYDITSTATGGNCVDAEWVDVTLSGGVGVKVPTVATLPGCRMIDLAYCIPTMFVGTSWLNGSYTNNDYVQCVQLNGAAGYPSINNCLNSAGPNQPPWNGGPAPFSAHPPDYEKFSAAAGKTTVLKLDSTYTILAQVGTWYSSNYLAAWIDYNHDGDFYDIVGGQNEKIMQSPGLSNNSWSSAAVGTFTVPSSAYIGSTTLRVREVYAVGNIDPCNTYTYGETEDYPITIIPDCNILPGWRVWLGGFSNDWNVSLNWCGGVPTLTTDAAIIPDIDPVTPGIQRPVYQPVIKAGVSALANKLRIDGADTLTINGSTGATLTVADSLDIRTGSSMLKVIDSYRSQAEISNGTLVNANSFLFNGGGFFLRQKAQILYGQAEFLARGMQPGDVIDTISLYISARNSTVPYLQFTLGYYYTTANYSFPGTPTAWAPVFSSGSTLLGPMTLDLTTIPSSGGWVHFPVNLTWSGSTGDMVIEMCWENGASSSPPSDNNYTTQTLGVRKMATVRGWSTSGPGCSLLPNGAANTFRTANDYRPNLTFRFRRNYDKVPIEVRGHWNNNGTFISSDNSIVKFAGTNQQHLGGSSSTTFHELQMLNSQGVYQYTSSTVNDTMWLNTGKFVINADGVGIKTLTLGLASRYALWRPPGFTGFLQSENPAPNYGMVKWNLGTTTAPIVLPFVTSGGTLIYLEIQLTSGAADLTVATYPTPPNNTPWPTGVTNISGYYSPYLADNSPNMVDRYWVIGNDSSAATWYINFNFAASEAAGVTGPYLSQRWDGSIWHAPLPGQASGSTWNSTGTIADMNSVWVLTGQNQPLPVELLNFDAKAEEARVRVEWSTSSEVDNDYFDVERSVDNRTYTFVGRVPSQGPSTQQRQYTAFDDQPLEGLSYYRLRQVDYDGDFRHYGPVAVVYGKDKGLEIVTMMSPSEGRYRVVYRYGSERPLAVRVVDATGRVVYGRDGMKASPGLNDLELTMDLSQGVYTLFLQSEDGLVSRKFFR